MECKQFVERAMRRTAAVVHQEMASGLNSLATMAVVAPLVGMFGTLVGIANSFGGVGADKITVMAAIAKCLSLAMIPTALGLLAGLIAMCGYRYRNARLTGFDREMENASLALVNELSRHGGRLKPGF